MGGLESHRLIALGPAGFAASGRRCPLAINGRRSKPLPVTLPAPSDDPSPIDGEVMPNASSLQADIPPHVWALLQEAGELAAGRLVQILQSPAFASYAPSAQRGLIELALTRAYGLPIRKALTVTLSSTDADAVAASLADLAGNLPEHARSAVRDALDGASREEDDRQST